MLHICWSHIPKDRPSAAEIVELLYNSPRLLSPCIDVPLASVQPLLTNSTEKLTKPRKASIPLSQKPRQHLKIQKIPETLSVDAGYGSGAYSPMTGDMPLTSDDPSDVDSDRLSDEGDYSSSFPPHTSSAWCGGGNTAPGYIVLDHGGYEAGSVTSV